MQYYLRKNHNAHAGDDKRKINYEWPNEKDISEVRFNIFILLNQSWHALIKGPC